MAIFSPLSWRVFIWALLPPAWFVVMAYLFFIEIENLTEIHWLLALPSIDKIAHFGLFAIFTFIQLLSGNKLFNWSRIRLVTMTMLLGIVWGTSAELIQYFFKDTRSGRVDDLIANLIGAIFGCIAYYALISRLPASISCFLLTPISSSVESTD